MSVLADVLMGSASVLAIAKTIPAFVFMASGAIAARSGEKYRVSRSLRFRSSASAYLSRTFGSASSTQTKGHLHFCVKRGALGSIQEIFDCHDGVSAAPSLVRFLSGDTLEVALGGSSAKNIITSAVFRDPNAWYVIDVAIDTTDATNTNRIKLWVNGVQVTSFGTTNWPSQNDVHQFAINTANNRIGVNYNASANYLNAYLANLHWIDGAPKTPSDFGQVDPVTGEWSLKQYSGSYGANGFKLDFSDNSGVTSTTIGKDRSGNNNDFTPTNISVTAGSTNDSLVDIPTNYGESSGAGGDVRGNYCVLNSICAYNIAATFSEGGLKVTAPSGSAFGDNAIGTFCMTSGKWYFECTGTQLDSGSNVLRIGISLDGLPGGSQYVMYVGDGNKYISGSTTAYGATYGVNDVIGVAVDCGGGTVTFYKNGVSQGAITATVTPFFPAARMVRGTSAGTIHVFNFGQRPFAYAAPSGYKALCTQNLPEPTIRKPSQYFNAKTYTATGAAQSITGVGHQPDILWLKPRSAATSHYTADTARGIANLLTSNSTATEVTNGNFVTSLDTDGFSLGSGNHANGTTMVGWCWKEGSAPGLDIVSYAGNGSLRTISHDLGVAPKLYVVKRRDVAVGDWVVWNTDVAAVNANNVVFFNETGGGFTAASNFNGTAPTSSVFTVNTNGAVNASGSNYITYLFAEVAGFSKISKYTGNGSSDGPFVWCGFRPRFIILKRIDTTGNWVMHDAARSQFNVINETLWANLTTAEGGSGGFDFLSNGFKIKTTASDDNASGGSYIFMAFAENPFKYARAA